jgi:predicted nucleic acid-binding protein
MTAVLVDTSVWVDHFRRGNQALVQLLGQDRVLMHPSILGEIACGTPPQRSQTLADLASLQSAQQASLPEMLEFIEREQLFGRGCGWVDLQLLAATCLSEGAVLWSLDQRLQALAERVGRAYPSPVH